LSPHHLSGGCDIVMQVGTAKYGVRNEAGAFSDQKLRELAEIEQVRMFELKLSQGAKPGKGGILPGIKVTSEIAAIRGIPAGQDSISPNRHVEIDSPGELLDMVAHIRQVTGKPVGFKLVLGGCNALGCIQAMQCHQNTCPTGITTHQKRLQRGLDPQDKAVRVWHYVENMRHDVGVIAHSCGVKHPRQLQRRHARVVIQDGSSAGLHMIYPETEVGFPHGKNQNQQASTTEDTESTEETQSRSHK